MALGPFPDLQHLQEPFCPSTKYPTISSIFQPSRAFLKDACISYWTRNSVKWCKMESRPKTSPTQTVATWSISSWSVQIGIGAGGSRLASLFQRIAEVAHLFQHCSFEQSHQDLSRSCSEDPCNRLYKTTKDHIIDPCQGVRASGMITSCSRNHSTSSCFSFPIANCKQCLVTGSCKWRSSTMHSFKRTWNLQTNNAYEGSSFPFWPSFRNQNRVRNISIALWGVLQKTG